jgi:hypothetical protein
VGVTSFIATAAMLNITHPIHRSFSSGNVLGF